MYPKRITSYSAIKTCFRYLIHFFFSWNFTLCSLYGNCEDFTAMDYFQKFEIYILYIACLFHTIFWALALRAADIFKDGGRLSSKSSNRVDQLVSSENTYYNSDEDVMAECLNVEQYFSQQKSDQVVAVKQLHKVYGSAQQK